MENNGPLPLEDAPINDFSSPEEIFKQRCRNLIMTQCSKSVEIINDGSQGRPVTLTDFRQTLEQSIKALNVSLHENFIVLLLIKNIAEPDIGSTMMISIKNLLDDNYNIQHGPTMNRILDL